VIPRKHTAWVTVAAVSVLIGAAGGIASSGAATSPVEADAKAKTVSAATTARRADRRRAHPVHNEAVVLNTAGTEFITATSDHGTIKAISGSVLTVHEGTDAVAYEDVEVSIASGAAVRRNGAKAALAELMVGDNVHVTSSEDGTTVVAHDSTWQPTRRVAAVPAVRAAAVTARTAWVLEVPAAYLPLHSLLATRRSRPTAQRPTLDAPRPGDTQHLRPCHVPAGPQSGGYAQAPS